MFKLSSLLIKSFVVATLCFCFFFLKTVFAEKSGATISLDNVERYFANLNISNYIVKAELAALNPLCNQEQNKVIILPEDKIEEYILAGIQDKATVIRLFKELAERVNEQGLSLCGEGDILNTIIERHQIELGLSLPMTALAFYAWHPVISETSTESAVELKLLYRNSYIHNFEAEVLPADLKIGTGMELSYGYNTEQVDGKLVNMNVFFSRERFGFRGINGVSVRPHGIMGLFLDLFFFLPDAVDSMYVENNRLVTEALVTTYIEEFETTEKYQMQSKKLMRN